MAARRRERKGVWKSIGTKNCAQQNAYAMAGSV
jgi:hypothetical protein